LISEILRATISLLVIVDPLGNIPIFVSLTEKMEEGTRVKTFKMAVLIGFSLLFLFAIFGLEILSLFNISIPSFRVAGGLLLLIIAVEILVRGGWHYKGNKPETAGAVPMGFPLLAGPGAITATIVNIHAYGLPITIGSIIFVSLITWIVLRHIDLVYSFLGEVGCEVVARVMAILIASIAIQFIIEGFLFYVKT
jgi:multiple antibiotic resistance protein